MNKNTSIITKWWQKYRTRVEKVFDSLPNNVFRTTELDAIFSEKKDDWELEPLKYDSVRRQMVAASHLKKIELSFPHRKEIRYVWREASATKIALSLHPDSYLSHFSAMVHHALTDQLPRIIYVNVEQSPPPGRSRKLSQAAVDTAFRRKARVSNRVARLGEVNVCVLNSMGVGGLGIEEIVLEPGEIVRVTSLIRTLIDIAVRPMYAGGVFAVLEAFRRATGQYEIPELISLLKEMDYVYPYHQAIGFLIERAGTYSQSEIDQFKSMPKKINFYLAHAMEGAQFSKEWRLYHPQGL